MIGIFLEPPMCAIMANWNYFPSIDYVEIRAWWLDFAPLFFDMSPLPFLFITFNLNIILLYHNKSRKVAVKEQLSVVMSLLGVI